MPDAAQQHVYSPVARMFHWVVAGFVFAMIPVGVIMADRGARNVWDGLTNTLYSSHKLAGFVLLFIMTARLGYRLARGAPPPEPGLEPWQKAVSGATHWAIYALLFAMAITGWLGTSLYPSLEVFGLFSLPAIVAPDQAAAGRAFALHRAMGYLLAFLIAMHVAAALHHHFIRKDGVLRRMLPKRS